MTTTRKLFRPTTVTHLVTSSGTGELVVPIGAPKWGATPFETSNASWTTATKRVQQTGRFDGFTPVAGDKFRIISGTASGGIVAGDYDIETAGGTYGANYITLTVNTPNPSNNGTAIVGYVVQSAMAASLLHYPTSLPAAHSIAPYNYDDYCCIRPRDAVGKIASTVLKFSGWQNLDDASSIEDTATALGADSVLASFGGRHCDLLNDGIGSRFITRIQQVDDFGGPIANIIENEDESAFYDGGVAASGDFEMYLQPGTFSATFITALAEIVTPGYGIVMQVQQDTNDEADACSLLGFNGPILAIDFSSNPVWPNPNKSRAHKLLLGLLDQEMHGAA